MRVVNRLETMKAVFEALGLDISEPYTKVTIELSGKYPTVTTEKMIYKDQGAAFAKALGDFSLLPKD